MKQPTKRGWASLAGGLCLAMLAGCRQDSPKASEPSLTSPSPAMSATIHRHHHFREIPSASGMELAGGKLYVVGDDSPFLYVLDQSTLRQSGRIRLFESDDFGSGRIPKLLKPDLECLTLLEVNGVNTLVAFGSGATDKRNRCYSISLPADPQAPPRVQEHSLKNLYEALQADKKLLGQEVLNIEAAATSPDHLLLLQRAAQGGPNLLLAFPKKEFVAYLTGSRQEAPGYSAIPFHLPNLAGLPARFSGAVVYGRHLFFTASVENTTDAILDGEVLGSFVGWVDLGALQPGQPPLEVATALVLHQEGKPFPGKVESLVILGSPRPHTFRALAMTDNDQGQSDLLELEIRTAAGH